MESPKLIFDTERGNLTYAGLRIPVRPSTTSYNNEKVPLEDTLNLLGSFVTGTVDNFYIALNESDGICSISLKNNTFTIALGCAMDILPYAELICPYVENKTDIDNLCVSQFGLAHPRCDF